MNRLKRVRISSFILSIILFSSLSWAQHFLFTDLTGNNMTVVVPTSIAPTIDGSPIEIGDEIGVFPPADLCVGASVWTGSNIAITVWGDDDQTGGDPDGMVTGEALSFKMWDASASTEYDAVVTYSSGVGTYTPDGISVLASLVGMVPPEITLDPVSQDKYVGEDVDFTIAATGTAPITYQWKKDGADLPGETGTTLSLTSLTLADEGDYTCVATNAVGSDESTAATLTVSIRPAITVTSPNGGNLLVVGTTYEITWNS